MKRLLPALLVCACVLPNDVVGVSGADGGFGGGTAFAPVETQGSDSPDDTAGGTAMPPEPETCTVGVCTCAESPCHQVCEPIIEDVPCAMACPDDHECWFDCPEGGCEFVCQPNAICHLNCPGGGCTMNCTFSELCEMDCSAEPGDDPCSGTCGAEICTINCPTNSCVLDCFDASECSTTNCEAECSVACNNVNQCEGSCEDVNAECLPY